MYKPSNDSYSLLYNQTATNFLDSNRSVFNNQSKLSLSEINPFSIPNISESDLRDYDKMSSFRDIKDSSLNFNESIDLE